MNKEELEQAFNETTDNAVDLLKENVELKKKYAIMKENAETLANRIDRAVDYIEKNNYVDTDIVLDILQYGCFEEGGDKE